MQSSSLKTRMATDRLIKVIAVLSALIGLLALVWILVTVVGKGIGALDFKFFTELPTPPGMIGGGLVNAIVGTIIMTILAALIAIPIGLLAGTYLAEIGKGSRLADIIRMVNNILIGVPSIIVGIFVYALLVIPMRSFSGYAGAAALAVIMLPIVVRTTEDMLTLVPDSLRESALALGVSRWRTTFDVVFRAAKQGLMTGVLLAVARVSGETAPLLFTALNSAYWFDSLKEPVANLTVTIFNYAMSPYSDWQQKAWGASLLITMGVLFLTITARLIMKKQRKQA
ncbi:phosphate ABC transporter permease PstA [bacterium]|nr:phosphate ABC transporter permease PstA [bacterium]